MNLSPIKGQLTKQIKETTNVTEWQQNFWNRKEVQKRGAVDGDLYMIKDGVVVFTALIIGSLTEIDFSFLGARFRLDYDSLIVLWKSL